MAGHGADHSVMPSGGEFHRRYRHRGRLTLVWAAVAVAFAVTAFIGGHWLAGVYLTALPVVMVALVVATRRPGRPDHVDGPGGRSQ